MRKFNITPVTIFVYLWFALVIGGGIALLGNVYELLGSIL